MHDSHHPPGSITDYLPGSYGYGDPEYYVESPHTSSSTSPVDPSYDLHYSQHYDFEQIDPSIDINLSESQQSASKPVAKRKRENRYKNAPPSVLSRRRAQNRASQRAYRERKDQRIKDLEVLLNEAQQKNDVLSQAYASLQTEYIKLKTESEPPLPFQQTSNTFARSIPESSQPSMVPYLFTEVPGYFPSSASDVWT